MLKVSRNDRIYVVGWIKPGFRLFFHHYTEFEQVELSSFQNSLFFGFSVFAIQLLFNKLKKRCKDYNFLQIPEKFRKFGILNSM